MVASNYEHICEVNRARYGTEGAQKSGELAAGLYDDRAHFIFELLQNAEDALGRREDRRGSESVAFALHADRLTLSHYGKPFDEADVRSVCDIAQSRKNDQSIGRFGLGFKSVYTVTDRPEIHSGDEDFAIEGYVYPKREERTVRGTDETQIVLPLKAGDSAASLEITAGFRKLSPRALLFLRNIDEIRWEVEGGSSGFYLRNKPEALGDNVQRITVMGLEEGQSEVDETWLVFHKDVSLADQAKVGRVEIAFSLTADKDGWAIQPLASSPLVVFFPTVVESHLGFLVQGPYRTTPSRDNIPPGDTWNQQLVQETASLLVEALHWLREKQMLDASALRCLPLDRGKFLQGPGARFAPLFAAVWQAFQDQPLLPRFEGGYVLAQEAKLARSQELRELFSPDQVAGVFGLPAAAWLSGDITSDKTPELRQYLIKELGVEEVRPERLVPSLSKEFLESQPDEWVARLYEFLNGQETAVRRRLETVPLVRLEDGTHVLAYDGGESTAFLPSNTATGFPTVARAVCATPTARSFLASLGITEPDPVDDIIRNVLPAYIGDSVAVDDQTYAADIERILLASRSDLTESQRKKLVAALEDAHIVMVVDIGDGEAYVAKPGEVYIASDRLRQLFAGVSGVFIVDQEYECLRGEGIRELLVRCGADRYLTPQRIPSGLDPVEKAQIRREAGLERASWEEPPEDFTLRGLPELLEFLRTLKAEDAAARAKVLWDALVDLEGSNKAVFSGSYKWRYFHETKTARFDADFVRTLNELAWVPNADGELVPPHHVVFETLGWKANHFLQTKITFKPPRIEQLAKEVGIDPAILDLLCRDPSVVAELASRIRRDGSAGVEPMTPAGETHPDQPDGDVYDEARDLYGDGMPDIPAATPDPTGGDSAGIGAARGGEGRSGGGAASGGGGRHGGPQSAGGQGASGGTGSAHGRCQGKRTPGSGSGSRPFISYVGAHPDEDGSDPDGLTQADRMDLEAQAIDVILTFEPALRRTAAGNPGFDLYEQDDRSRMLRWVEVKAMAGSLDDRPVGLSHTQFDFAREKADAYWLYVVEHAGNKNLAKVVRIQNPAAHARTFTFDHGWRAIARELDPESVGVE